MNDKLTHVIKQLLKNPVNINLSQEKMSPTTIKQEFYIADNVAHKMRLLQHFMEQANVFKGIIFSATKINADKLAKQLRENGFAAEALHGDLKQNARNRIIQQFHRGKIQFLVATDIAARGLDVMDITHVINFDLPKFAEDYVHRIGRTGRAGKSGIAISLIMASDSRHLFKIERLVGHKLEMVTVPGLEPQNKNIRNPAPNKKRKNHWQEKKEKSMKFSGKKTFSGEKKFGKDFSAKRKSDNRDAYGSGEGRKEKFTGEKKFERDFSAKRKSDSRDGSVRGEGRKEKFSGEKKFGKDFSAKRKSDGQGEQRKRGKFSGEKKRYPKPRDE